MMNEWEQFMLLRITQAVEKIANLSSEKSREEEMVKMAESHGYVPPEKPKDNRDAALRIAETLLKGN